MKKERKKEVAESGGRGILPKAVRLFAWKGGTGVSPVYVGKRGNLIERLGAPLQHTAGTAMPHSQTTGAASAYALRDSGLASRRENWDACGLRLVTYASESEASLPTLFEGRCRAVRAYGAPRRFKHGADNQAAGRWRGSASQMARRAQRAGREQGKASPSSSLSTSPSVSPVSSVVNPSPSHFQLN